MGGRPGAGYIRIKTQPSLVELGMSMAIIVYSMYSVDAYNLLGRINVPDCPGKLLDRDDRDAKNSQKQGKW